MIGWTELLVILTVGAVVFLFGKDKVKEWLTLGKEIKSENTTK